jgi:hypothetical protein
VSLNRPAATGQMASALTLFRRSRRSRSGWLGTKTARYFVRILDSGGGVPIDFLIELTVDLNGGEATGSWTLPDGTQQTPSFGPSS